MTVTYSTSAAKAVEAERDRWRELALAYEAVIDDLVDASDYSDHPVWADPRLRRIELARVGLVSPRVGGSSL